VEAMQEAGKYIEGTHDFASFCASGAQVKTTVRTVREVFVYREQSAAGSGEEIVIRVTGEGFLYNMVRIIAGTLIKVGKGLYPPEQVSRIIEARDRSKAGDTAPARGLFLVKIEYKEDQIECR